MKICTSRSYRLIIPLAMRTDIARTVSASYLMAPVLHGEASLYHAAIQIDALIKAVSEKNGLLAAMLTQDIQIEISTTIKDLTENTIQFNKERVSYEEFLERQEGL